MENVRRITYWLEPAEKIKHCFRLQVMSADAFGAFKEVGLENRGALAEVGRRFLFH